MPGVKKVTRSPLGEWKLCFSKEEKNYEQGAGFRLAPE
jgi:hypothetical protein